jgi:hypothetical protein
MNNNFFLQGKSAVNFCEKDSYDTFNGEMWNVISSIIMSLFGLYGICISHKKNSIILNTLLCLIGLGSAFFHYELSPFAHWIDIIFISIILIYSLYCIDHSTKNKNIFYSLVFVGHLFTSLYIPQIHIFIQFITGFILQNRIEYVLSINSIGHNNYDKLLQSYSITKKIFIGALIFWLIDYAGCKFITPYHTHWIFHILIGLVSYRVIKLVNYV